MSGDSLGKKPILESAFLESVMWRMSERPKWACEVLEGVFQILSRMPEDYTVQKIEIKDADTLSAVKVLYRGKKIFSVEITQDTHEAIFKPLRGTSDLGSHSSASVSYNVVPQKSARLKPDKIKLDDNQAEAITQIIMHLPKIGIMPSHQRAITLACENVEGELRDARENRGYCPKNSV